ncbi:thiosulfate/3-mercaptopyruvate sulfurtransferase [Fodinibius salinus]|uniref:Sulfurtransferase n=1 Tax=Fodinibius salinus TaxID=860790 RepID=A0A5D3YJZ8_9BACT|nr:sulfurtransferase [Fodinibius salinus]TYP93770.1 thiosulfate/3-mercaptopyruvate sulfurtransferase [Fodinibius salinus]
MPDVLTNEQTLVNLEWASEHLNDEDVRFVEIDVDTQSYDSGHIPGAIGWNWKTQLQDQLKRTIASKEDFEKLLQESGIDEDTTVVVYGDNNNWFAAWAYWLLKYYGHEKAKVLDGGRKKWIAEDRELTTETPDYETSDYTIDEVESEYRAFRDDVKEKLESDDFGLVDVRSPEEFNGEIIAPKGVKELSLRAGHIPGASNIPWSTAVNEDGTFKSKEELQEIYEQEGITPDKDIVAYCRIGERSAHTWLVLNELLEYPNVKNYDGSWTEWGNLINAPIER